VQSNPIVQGKIVKQTDRDILNSTLIVQGKIIRKYELPYDEIDELNTLFEKEKDKLESFSKRLAGNIKTELKVNDLLTRTSIINSIYKCMQDCTLQNSKLTHLPINESIKDYHISDAWINDMKDGEWNPPHIHHVDRLGPSGWSTVLFLRTPKMIKEDEPHKKHLNGKLSFTDERGENSITVDPKVGDFYIFGAGHQHFVMPLQLENKNEIRRSLSFNYKIIYK
tara:strand:+ start:801 stop:1472 length:672 start_codon:yes stop_codon:yes gene_type:complete